jgi:hypothetical protein
MICYRSPAFWFRFAIYAVFFLIFFGAIIGIGGGQGLQDFGTDQDMLMINVFHPVASICLAWWLASRDWSRKNEREN